MWVSTLLAEGTNDPSKVPILVWIGSIAGYTSSLTGLFAGWKSEGPGSPRQERLVEELVRTLLRPGKSHGEIKEAERQLELYRYRSILRLHMLADLMLVLALLAAIAGPAVGLALGSYWAGAAIGGVAAPAAVAYRRAEKAAARREAAADDTSTRQVELERQRWELDRDRALFELEVAEKKKEIERAKRTQDGEP